jgi:hypothetical protein
MVTLSRDNMAAAAARHISTSAMADARRAPTKNRRSALDFNTV